MDFQSPEELMEEITIIDITEENAAKEGLFCLRNRANPGFVAKVSWLAARRKEGLRLRVLKVDGEPAGFIEYVPSENAWRPIEAPGYLFVHCLWVYPKKYLGLGLAGRLIEACILDAREQGRAGVAVMVSRGSWIAGPGVFGKYGFEIIEEKGRFILMARTFGGSSRPALRDWESEAGKYQGLHLLLAHQCPLFSKSLEEMRKTARAHGLDLRVTLLGSAEEAQLSPSGYGVYSLVYDGRVLADHYISNTRFSNILKKEL